MNREYKYESLKIRVEEFFIFATQKLTRFEDEEHFHPSQNYKYAIFKGRSHEEQHIVSNGLATDNELNGIITPEYVEKHLKRFIRDQREFC